MIAMGFPRFSGAKRSLIIEYAVGAKTASPIPTPARYGHDALSGEADDQQVSPVIVIGEPPDRQPR